MHLFSPCFVKMAIFGKKKFFRKWQNSLGCFHQLIFIKAPILTNATQNHHLIRLELQISGNVPVLMHVLYTQDNTTRHLYCWSITHLTHVSLLVVMNTLSPLTLLILLLVFWQWYSIFSGNYKSQLMQTLKIFLFMYYWIQ